MTGDLPAILAAAPPVLGLTILGLAIFVAAREAVRRARHRRLLRGARLVTVLAPPRVLDDGAEALWGNLAGLLRPAWRRVLTGQPHLSFEYRITPDGATIGIWVPGPVPPGLVERAVAAAWPGATTRTALSRPPASARRDRGWRAIAAGGVLRLARHSGLPISDTAPGDPVAALLAAAGDIPARHARGDDTDRGSKNPAEDEVAVQILVRPVPARRTNRTHGRGLPGGPVVEAAAGAVLWMAREVLTIATPGPVTGRGRTAGTSRAVTPAASPDPRARMERSSGDRAAVNKARRAAFETLVRYAATTHTPRTHDRARDRDRMRQARRVTRGRAHAATAVFASFADHNFYRRRHLPRPAHAIAGRRLGRGDLLSVAELAAIATLPTGHAPGLRRAGARAVAPPPGIPLPGPDVKPLGDTTGGDLTGIGGGRGRPVGLRVADARHHLHVIGATGSGKSTLLVQMILADIRHHRGVVVIDPKGDLVTDVLDRLPAAVRARAVLIDPDQPGPPPSLNPLTPAPSRPNTNQGPAAVEAQRALAVENLVAICRRIFSAYWGPRTDDLMRAACLTLCAQPTPRSLGDLPALLTDPDVRARHMRAVTDPVLRGFWNSYDQLSDPARAQIIAPLMNKIRALLLRPFTRAVLTAARPDRPPPVDMTAVLDGGILLARIPKGSLGDEGTRLVGSIVVAHTWAATTARAHSPQHQRRDAALVIDECHNFLNLPYSIDDLLAEARGLRLSLTLAHQNLAQLPRDLRAGISTNARNKILFTVGPDDARDLARHTTPHLDEHDLAHLDAFHAAARLVHHDAETPAFTLLTRPLPTPGRGRAVPAQRRGGPAQRRGGAVTPARVTDHGA